MAPSLPFSPSCSRSPPAACLQADVLQLWALALVFLWLGVSAHVCHQNPTHASSLFLYFFFFSRGRKWSNIPSFVLRHFAFMSVQHCLVVMSLHPCLPASLHTIFLLPSPVTVGGCVISCLSKDHLLISFLVPFIASIVPSPLIA